MFALVQLCVLLIVYHILHSFSVNFNHNNKTCYNQCSLNDCRYNILFVLQMFKT